MICLKTNHNIIESWCQFGIETGDWKDFSTVSQLWLDWELWKVDKTFHSKYRKSRQDTSVTGIVEIRKLIFFYGIMDSYSNITKINNTYILAHIHGYWLKQWCFQNGCDGPEELDWNNKLQHFIDWVSEGGGCLLTFKLAKIYSALPTFHKSLFPIFFWHLEWENTFEVISSVWVCDPISSNILSGAFVGPCSSHSQA